MFLKMTSECLTNSILECYLENRSKLMLLCDERIEHRLRTGGIELTEDWQKCESSSLGNIVDVLVEGQFLIKRHSESLHVLREGDWCPSDGYGDQRLTASLTMFKTLQIATC